MAGISTALWSLSLVMSKAEAPGPTPRADAMFAGLAAVEILSVNQAHYMEFIMTLKLDSQNVTFTWSPFNIRILC